MRVMFAGWDGLGCALYAPDHAFEVAIAIVITEMQRLEIVRKLQDEFRQGEAH